MIIALTRTLILYLLIIIGIRLMGKRQIGQLEPSELVLSLLIADLAAVPMQDFGIPLFMGIIPILTLLCISTILSVLTVKNIRIRALLCSRPSIVIRDGKILPKEMNKNRFTLDELMEELRTNGVTDITTIKYAILETNGRISVLPYTNEQAVTPKQMNLPTQEGGLPAIIINNGRLLTHNLKARGLELSWIEKQLQSRGIHSFDEVFLLTVDEQNKIYISEKVGQV
ncbi:MAG: DUF421 domain-containing protein [Evtepia sp.]